MDIMKHMTETVVMFWYFLICTLIAWTIVYYVKKAGQWVWNRIRSWLTRHKKV